MTPSISSVTRRHIHVRGVVQGVGFRPFVYNLAQSLALTGYVYNSSSGVTIEIEGTDVAIEEFVRTLRLDPPQLAEISAITVTSIEVQATIGFRILESREEAGAFGLVPPDAGTCDACWRDFGDPLNRRYGYPFTNCTHCGPRFTIIQDIPYDRATTTMSSFTMCSACAAEYREPGDRRFHAQPNACAQCGPSLCLVPRGSSLPDVAFPDVAFPGVAFIEKDSLAIIRHARKLLREGKILAVKGLGGFLLACDARNDDAVRELRTRKHRSDKPFALMARDVASVRMLCDVSAADEAALLHRRRPIVILPRLRDADVAESVAPELRDAAGIDIARGSRTLGVMLPYTPLHYLLFSDSPHEPSEFPALVMTSGNLSEEPIVVSNEEALRGLDGIADWFLLHNRDIDVRVDDSVVRTFEGTERVLRRSRGFAPQALDLGMDLGMDAGLSMQEVLAFGGELKNTFCLTKDRYAILSQHIGDLENYETMQFFDETLAHLKHLFRIEPRIAAYDLHPGYMSTRMALASGIERKIGVQHHHAHIASCMAENHLRGKVIGVAFDGTGYGTDGRIWGGEFLVADFAGFKRRAHLRNVLLPGGDAAVRQPWRMARSYLRDAFGEQLPADIPCFRGVNEKQIAIVDRMLSQRLNTVETSSSGRLFDAVAALVGLGAEVTFEGQAAIALEAHAEPSVAGHGINHRYEFELDYSDDDGDTTVLDFRPMIHKIASDVASGKAVSEISARFHNTLSAAIVEACCRIRKSDGLNKTDGLNRICLSGGTFQNLYLLHRTVTELRRSDFEVFLHAMVPCNDGGIALGQAVIANQQFQQEV